MALCLALLSSFDFTFDVLFYIIMENTIRRNKVKEKASNATLLINLLKTIKSLNSF